MSKYAAVNVKFGADISEFSTAMQNATRQMKKASDQLINVGKSMTMNLTAPIVALGAAALYSFGEIDSLKRGLVSFAGSAELAEAEFNKLRKVAELPGLGLEEAVRGSINLQAIGMNADDARRAMMSFGNAIATVGGGKENFDLAIRGFGQLVNASKPLQQDLYQIANQLPQVNKLMMDAFGTNRAEDLAKLGLSGKQLADFLVTELGKLPKVSGGIKNAFENMSDSVKVSLASLGESIEKNFNISDKINALSEWLGDLIEAFNNLSPTTQKFILGALALVAALGPLSLAIGGIISIMPMLVAGFTALTGPIGLTVIGIGLITAALLKYGLSVSDAEALSNKYKKSLTDINNEAKTQTTRLQELYNKLSDSNLPLAERVRLIKEFNSIAGTNLTNISNEAEFQRQLAKAYEDTATAIKAKQYQSLEAQRTELEAQQKLIQSQIKSAKLEKEKYDRENVIKLPFGLEMTTTPISDALYETPREKLKSLEDQADVTKEAIRELSREMYNISTNGEIANPIKPKTPEPINVSTKEMKKEDWSPSDIQKYNLEQLKLQNERTIDEMNSFIDKKNQADSKKISDSIKNNVAYKKTLDVAQIDQDNAFVRQLESLRRHQENMRKTWQDMNDIIERGVEDMVVSLAQAFGENLIDGEPFENLQYVLLDSLGKLMQALGAYMIQFGIFFKIFQEGIKNMNPYVAIAAGIGMVAAGAAISKVAQKGMQPVGGTYGGTSSGGSTSGSELTLTTRVDGRDLVMSGDETTRVKRR